MSMVASRDPGSSRACAACVAGFWGRAIPSPKSSLDDLPPLWCILAQSASPINADPNADVAQW